MRIDTTDFAAVTRATSTVTVHARPAVRELGGGAEHSTVACPLCRTRVVLCGSVRGPEGRCEGCTVIVRLDSQGRAKACGWMGGGDMVKASVPLRRRRSPLDEPRPAKRRRPVKTRKVQPCGTPAAATRHRRNGEALCAACDVADRAYRNKQRRAQRARRRQETAA